jgi:hypothetical protein
MSTAGFILPPTLKPLGQWLENGKKPLIDQANKWAGVYYYALKAMWNGKPDRCYYITYRNGRKMVWKKAGLLSEGYGPEVASDLRAKTIMSRNTSQEVLTPKEEGQECERRDKTFIKMAYIYFSTKGGA